MAQMAMALAGLTAASFAVLMVFQRSLYASAICLLVVLLQAAVFFFFAGAPLLAFLQVMIYAGAVMVLVVVAVMSAPSPPADLWSRLSLPGPLVALGLLAPVLETVLFLWRGEHSPGSIGNALEVQSRIGPVLFGNYAVGTEAVGLLLFLSALAMTGSRRRAR